MATRYQGAPDEVRALDTFIKLIRASEAVFSRLDGELAAHELTHPQLAVLEALHHGGSACQRDLSEKLLRSNSNLSTLLDRLEQRGLVERTRDPADRRRVEVSLTAEGARLIREVFPLHAMRITELFSVLSADEQQQLSDICKRLGRHARR